VAVAPDLIKTGANVMKLSFYVVDAAENKLERLTLISFKAGLVCASKGKGKYHRERPHYKVRGHIHNTSFSSYLTNWPNSRLLHNIMLERLASDKHTNTLTSWSCS
jgi:hypothetical protein